MKRVSRYLLSSVLALCVTVAIADEPASATSTNLGVAPQSLQALEEAKELFVAALQSEGKERVDGLKASYDRLKMLCEADPVMPPARTIWAKMLLSVGDERSATATLQQAVLEQPEDPEAYLLLGNLAARKNQLAEAKLSFEAAATRLQTWSDDRLRLPGLRAQVEAGSAVVARARESLAMQSGKPELAQVYQREALEHLRRWVIDDPESAEAHDQLAVALLRAGMESEAIEAFDRARDLNPALPLTDLRLAQSQIASGNVEAAATRLQRAVEAHPDNVDVLVAAAELMLSMGKWTRAETTIDAAVKADPVRLDARRLEAQLHRFRGEFSAAAERLQTLNSEHPTDFETANLFAMTLTELGEDSRQRALPIATVTAQRFDVGTREGLRARITLIWAAHSAGQSDAAKRALNQLLNVGIESNRIGGDEGYFLSRLLADFGRPELAQPLLQSVLSRMGQFPKRKDAESLSDELN